MSDDRTSLRTQLNNAEENLRLLRERKSEYVQESDIPLQLIREERRLEQRIAHLRAALGGRGVPGMTSAPTQRRTWIAVVAALVIVLVATGVLWVNWPARNPVAQAPTDTPSTTPSQPTPTPSPTHWLYPIRVVEKDTGGAVPVPGARVVIETQSGAPLDNLTDSDGFTRISIPGARQGAPAVLRVTATGYEGYRQELDLYANTLPDTVELSPAD